MRAESLTFCRRNFWKSDGWGRKNSGDLLAGSFSKNLAISFFPAGASPWPRPRPKNRRRRTFSSASHNPVCQISPVIFGAPRSPRLIIINHLFACDQFLRLNLNFLNRLNVRVASCRQYIADAVPHSFRPRTIFQPFIIFQQHVQADVVNALAEPC